jgi:hypothetical protein
MDRTGGAGLDDRVWKNISIALGVICALLIGVAGALLIVGHKGGTPTDTSAPTASLIASEPTPSGSADAGPSGSASLTTPGPTTAPGTTVSPATVTFSNLAIDAASDPLGTTRTFTFQSNGAGPVIPTVTKISKNGWVHICLSVDGKKPYCLNNRANKGVGFSGAKADAAPSTWVVTIIGYKTSAPTVDVSFTWPTSSPQITLTHARFQGTGGASTAAKEALGGLTATFKPRGVGTLNVQATWTIVSTDASMTLSDVTSSPGVTLDQRKFTGVDHIVPAFTANVDATKTYQMKLVRTGADSTDRPDLTAQLSFP